jgi:hypothetical protein
MWLTMANFKKRTIDEELIEMKKMSIQTGFYIFVILIIIIFIIFIYPTADFLDKLMMLFIFVIIIIVGALVFILFFASLSLYRAIKFLKEAESATEVNDDDMVRVSAPVRFIFSLVKRFESIGIFPFKSTTPDNTPLDRPKVQRIKCPYCDKLQTVTLEVKAKEINCQECGIGLVVKA